MLKRAAALHVTSEEEARLIADVAPDVPRAVVPIGIRWDDFQTLPPPGSFRDRYLGGHSGPVVLFLGRLTFKKGLDVLVAGFARAAVPDAVLAIVGPDDEGMQPGLESLARHAGIGSRVVFTGMLRGEDKAAAIAAADVWALPSHTENFGLAVVEALAAGRPVLMSPAVNIAHDAGAARAAAICEPDANEFGYALGALLADHERRVELGARAREFARRYDWPRSRRAGRRCTNRRRRDDRGDGRDSREGRGAPCRAVRRVGPRARPGRRGRRQRRSHARAPAPSTAPRWSSTSGGYAAQNWALDHLVSTEWVLFLDADEYHPGRPGRAPHRSPRSQPRGTTAAQLRSSAASSSTPGGTRLPAAPVPAFARQVRGPPRPRARSWTGRSARSTSRSCTRTSRA